MTNNKEMALIDIGNFLPEETVLDTVLAQFFEYTEKDPDSINLRDDVLALGIGYQTVRVFSYLSALLAKEPFSDLTGKELSETIHYSINYFNARLDKEARDYDNL